MNEENILTLVDEETDMTYQCEIEEMEVLFTLLNDGIHILLQRK